MCSKRPCSLEKSFQNAKHLNFTTYFHVASRYSGDGSTITGRNISVLSPKLERNSYDTFELFNSLFQSLCACLKIGTQFVQMQIDLNNLNVIGSLESLTYLPDEVVRCLVGHLLFQK
mgnify:CR=1 FL=1